MEHLRAEEKGKLKEPKTCRIFFSSPFGGMEEEREELTRKYFPQIQHACNAKGVQFVAVDMRWGITSQAAENAQVINICLRELDRSDIFVGFFGQRYGWHGAEDKQLQENFDNAVGNYIWLDDVRDRSVTELEFLHGHLNNPGALPACICFRDKIYDDGQREEGLSKGDKKQVFKYSSESDHATFMMDDLKSRVKATESKCLGVDMAYPHPHKGAQFMFDSIWPYLTEVLLANVDTRKRTKREEQLEEHDVFRARYTSVYKGGEDYLNSLNSELEKGQGNVLISGRAGSGKSALLSNWTTQLETSHPGVAVIYHFIGCAPGTTDAHDILARLLMEVKHVAANGNESSTEDQSEDTQDVQKLQKLLLRELEKFVQKRQKQIVIVLDGLNRLPKGGKTSEHLYWIPRTWPQGVLCVASTVDTDADTFKLLVTDRQYHTLTISPLNETSKQDICVEVLKKSGKELSPEQLSRVVASEQTSNPLYLRLVVSELSIFGYFRLLDKKIDSLISCSDVQGLLQNIFTRLEEDYNEKEGDTNLVQEVLCAIELSKHGLLEKELMEMLELDSQMWLPLYFAMESLLVSHAGLLRFAFDEISQAVRAKYFKDAEEKTKMQKKLIGYFDKQLQSIPVSEDLMTPLSKRPVEELPWLQGGIGELDGLANTLLNIFTLHRMQQEFLYEFFELWKMTGRRMSEVCDSYLSAFDMALVDLYLQQQDLMASNSLTPPGIKLQPLLRSMVKLFDIATYPEGSMRVLLREVDIWMNVKGAVSSKDRFNSMIDAGYHLACSLVDCGRLKEGEERHRNIMETCRRHLKEDPDDKFLTQTLGFTCNGVGVVCVKERRWEEAIAMLEESIKHHSQLGNDRAVAEANTNLGLCHMENSNPEQSLIYFKEALRMSEELYFGHLPLELGNLLTNIGVCYRRLGDFDQAEAMYMRSLEVKINAVGPDHDVVAMAYMNLSTLCMHKQDYVKADDFIRKCMKIQEGNGATLEKAEYRNATENLISCLLTLSRVEEALPLYLPLFYKLREVDAIDYCIPSVHREMAKYLLHIGNTDTAREVTLALINSKVRDVQNYIFLDHLQLLMPQDQRPSLPSDHSLEHAFHTVWPGSPDIARRIIEYHALPAGDIDTIVKLTEKCLERNQQWGAYVYEASADWCMEADNKEAATQVLEAGLQKFPENVDFRVRLMDLYRKMAEHKRAYPHLTQIIEGRKNDPACLLVAADIAVHSCDYQLALECLEKVTAMDNPQFAELAEKHIKLLRDALSNNSEEDQGNQEPENPENREADIGNPENGEIDG